MNLTKKQRKMRQGVTVWIVSGFLKRDYRQSHMKKYVLKDKPHQSFELGLFISYKTSDGGTSSFSLMDCHAAGRQSYNLHRLFFSRRKAERYLKMLQEGCDVRSMFPKPSAYTVQGRAEKYFMTQALWGIAIKKPTDVVLLSGI